MACWAGRWERRGIVKGNALSFEPRSIFSKRRSKAERSSNYQSRIVPRVEEGENQVRRVDDYQRPPHRQRFPARERSPPGHPRPPLRREWLLAALIAGSAPILGYTAFSLGFVGYVTTLFKLSTAMTVLWGSLFLKERNLTQRLPGSLVMVVGAILIAL